MNNDFYTELKFLCFQHSKISKGIDEKAIDATLESLVNVFYDIMLIDLKSRKSDYSDDLFELVNTHLINVSHKCKLENRRKYESERKDKIKVKLSETPTPSSIYYVFEFILMKAYCNQTFTFKELKEYTQSEDEIINSNLEVIKGICIYLKWPIFTALLKDKTINKSQVEKCFAFGTVDPSALLQNIFNYFEYKNENK